MSAPSLSALSKRLDALEAKNRRLRRLAENSPERRALLSDPRVTKKLRKVLANKPLEQIRAVVNALPLTHSQPLGAISKEHLLQTDGLRRTMRLTPILTDAQREELRGNAPACNVQRFSLAESARINKAAGKRTYGGAA